MYNIDDLHASGKLPTRYYNQMNGKSAQENYRHYKMSRHKKNDNFILSFIQGMLSATMKAALDEIFKSWKMGK